MKLPHFYTEHSSFIADGHEFRISHSDILLFKWTGLEQNRAYRLTLSVKTGSFRQPFLISIRGILKRANFMSESIVVQSGSSTVTVATRNLLDEYHCYEFMNLYS